MRVQITFAVPFTRTWLNCASQFGGTTEKLRGREIVFATWGYSQRSAHDSSKHRISLRAQVASDGGVFVLQYSRGCFPLTG